MSDRRSKLLALANKRKQAEDHSSSEDEKPQKKVLKKTKSAISR
jgi:hypothetical protein